MRAGTHLSTFYSRAVFDSNGLQDALLNGLGLSPGEHSTVLTMGAEAILCDQGTLAENGFRWDQDSAVVIQVGR